MVFVYTEWNFDLISNCVSNLGYYLIEEELKNSNHRLLTLQDFDGYYYKTRLNDLLYMKTPSKFNKSNEFTCNNIILWCDINNKPFRLTSKKYISSRAKLKWQCLKENCNEMFEMSWTDIFIGCGCPYCSGRRISISNCLATKNPELAKQWHPTKNGDLTSYDVTCGSGKKAWWQCNNNKKHEWEAIIYQRNKTGISCPYCADKISTKKTKRRKQCEDYNLLVYSPEICEEWDYKKNDKLPSEFTPFSHQKVWWICKKCNSKWEAPIHRRVNNHGCPYCCGQKVN
jgi:hypothetical protein